MPWPVKVFWKDEEPILVEHPAKLEDLLDEWHETGFPGWVRIECPTGEAIGFGLGAPWSVVVCETAEGTKRTSIGDREETGGTVDFYFGAEPMEFARRNTIRPALAHQIVHEFVETGNLAPVIEWERG